MIKKEDIQVDRIAIGHDIHLRMTHKPTNLLVETSFKLGVPEYRARDILRSELNILVEKNRKD